MAELGKKLELNIFVVSSAQVFFHRFFALQSFGRHDRFIVATAALFLASKVEETKQGIQKTVKAYRALRRVEMDEKELEQAILVQERILIHTLSFDLQIVHAHPTCLAKIKELRTYITDKEVRQTFLQIAINFVNDSYRADVCLKFTPQQIALGAIFLATLHLDLKPSAKPTNQRSAAPELTWFKLIEAEINELVLRDLCSQILDVYTSDHEAQKPSPFTHIKLSELRAGVGAPSSLPHSSSTGGGGGGGDDDSAFPSVRVAPKVTVTAFVRNTDSTPGRPPSKPPPASPSAVSSTPPPPPESPTPPALAPLANFGATFGGGTPDSLPPPPPDTPDASLAPPLSGQKSARHESFDDPPPPPPATPDEGTAPSPSSIPSKKARVR